MTKRNGVFLVNFGIDSYAGTCYFFPKSWNNSHFAIPIPKYVRLLLAMLREFPIISDQLPCNCVVGSWYDISWLK